MRLGSYSKLTIRYYIPFEILERIGLISYRIVLPISMHTHNIFHVSLLKKYHPNANHVIDWNMI